MSRRVRPLVSDLIFERPDEPEASGPIGSLAEQLRAPRRGLNVTPSGSAALPRLGFLAAYPDGYGVAGACAWGSGGWVSD